MLSIASDPAHPLSADALFEAALDAGASDIQPLDGGRAEVAQGGHPTGRRHRSIAGAHVRVGALSGSWAVPRRVRWRKGGGASRQLLCAPMEVQRVRQELEKRGLRVESMELVYVPHTLSQVLPVTGATGNAKDLPTDSWEAFQSLVSQIDDLDDVIRVSHNHPSESAPDM